MNPEKNIETQLEQLAQAIPSGSSFVDGIMSRLETSSDNVQQKPKPTFVRRLVMKNTFKFAAAAIVLIAALLSLTLLDKTVAPAYALEQTIQACHSVRFIHLRQINPQHKEEPILIWAEFFENGQPKQIRMNLPEWAGSEDGAKEIVWENNAATVWFKKKQGFVRVPEKRMADEILKIVQEQDPKTYVKNLLDAQKNGKVEIQIEQPTDKAEPIRVTAIHLPDRASKLVLYIDQSTQLPLNGETYTLKDGDYVLANIGEFYDYNQPIDPAMFAFDNVPEDIMLVDQTKNQIGLIQGTMTNNEVAIEVVRRFWQAIIDKDYAKASQMYEGIPAAKLEQGFGKLENYKIEIVSVGPVQPHPNPKTRGVIVPCTIKMEVNGEIVEQTFDRIGVRQVYNQPGRWTIFGGL